ncbi:RNA polymerase sigma-E factor [Fulvivirga imtechensis AK7]|uniref:RNA polymerase sigma-E factor n=1 Tax=Fulvivirga imtechensis AK7 TaxID=1237149 RepID=L8JUT9_9BACT|nr:RNA polymerase sigma factor [Fulvivirga imtechensis]ELR72741.1 RNA polymerase sigma-E factor [Fulvivirga imtechensis AK7]
MSEKLESARVLEELLILRSQQGDRKSFELLVKRWHPRLVRHALFIVKDREVAQDIAQESWQSAIRGLPGLKDTGRFSSWIYRIAHNKSIDWIRKNKKEHEIMDNLELDIQKSAEDEPVITGELSAAERVKVTLNTLPDHQKLILTLFYLEEQSLKEIARILSLPEGTVKSRLFYAREQLKKKYKEVNHEKI